MLTVEQRHALIQSFEAAICALRVQPLKIEPHTPALDVAFLRAVMVETLQRKFYQELNACTNWGQHPAGMGVIGGRALDSPAVSTPARMVDAGQRVQL